MICLWSWRKSWLVASKKVTVSAGGGTAREIINLSRCFRNIHISHVKEREHPKAQHRQVMEGTVRQGKWQSSGWTQEIKACGMDTLSGLEKNPEELCLKSKLCYSSQCNQLWYVTGRVIIFNALIGKLADRLTVAECLHDGGGPLKAAKGDYRVSLSPAELLQATCQKCICRLE